LLEAVRVWERYLGAGIEESEESEN
jgi:hypothetical protein